ncbi:hypothetical protein RvY_07715 [Ramazzottius varieornatus]|uniref:Uncharacterized protein n=1 Tax=Ramazzottius varieornatus TaxID=947166 RepID=A0A1D1V390_RAMVA|nr:hypothetical protein RvY_07715 [Ramazzottius varieornatus]
MQPSAMHHSLPVGDCDGQFSSMLWREQCDSELYGRTVRTADKQARVQQLDNTSDRERDRYNSTPEAAHRGRFEEDHRSENRSS